MPGHPPKFPLGGGGQVQRTGSGIQMRGKRRPAVSATIEKKLLL